MTPWLVMTRNEIVRCFSAAVTATSYAEIVGGNRNTANAWYNDFRYKILLTTLTETQSKFISFEVDESYSGAKE